MFNVRITDCVECGSIQKMIKAIDCQLSAMADNLFTNLIYMLDRPVNAITMSTLLHYKRILTYRETNPEYMEEMCFENVTSRINSLTAGCKCCDEFTVPHGVKPPVITSSTTTTIME